MSEKHAPDTERRAPDSAGETRPVAERLDDDRATNWEAESGEEAEPEPADVDDEIFDIDGDEETDFGPEHDEEPEFEPYFGPSPGHAHAPKLVAGHQPVPRDEYGSDLKKAAGKKAAAKKAPKKKAPGPKKAPAPKKHAWHHAGPHGHRHGPGHYPGPAHHNAREYLDGPERGIEDGPGDLESTNFGWGSQFWPGFDTDSGLGDRASRGWFSPASLGRGGDVRAAILKLLTERAMPGYEMIQEIAARTHGLWRPSAGSIYPTLQLLDDEGLIAGAETQGSKKLFQLTDKGRSAAEKLQTPLWHDSTEGVDPDGQVDLRTVLAQLLGAVAQSTHAHTAEQQQSIITILKEARREIYLLLAE